MGRHPKHSIEEQERLQLEVAQLFKQHALEGLSFNMTKAGKEVGLQSRPYVRKLLQAAISTGTLKVEVVPPRRKRLANALCEKYPQLTTAVVVEPLRDSKQHRRMMGGVGAQFFEELVYDYAKNHSENEVLRIGMSGGYILHHLVMALKERKRPIELFPTAIIGRGPHISHVDPQTTVTLLWAKSGAVAGRAHYTTILPYNRSVPKRGSVDTPDMCARNMRNTNREMRTNNPVLAEVLTGARSIDVAFLSIGPADPTLASGIFQNSTIDLLSELGITTSFLRPDPSSKKPIAIGDVAYSFFDVAGRTYEEWDLFLTLGVDHFKEMVKNGKKVILVATKGISEVIRPVVRAGICNVLIVDSETAQLLVERDHP